MEKEENQIRDLISDATIINLVGKKSVEFGVKAGIIDKHNIKKVNGIPHAQCIRIF